MATPNAGLCSFTGQRIHKCFISCCMGTVRRGSSDIPAKQFWGFFIAFEQHTPWERCSSFRLRTQRANNKYSSGMLLTFLHISEIYKIQTESFLFIFLISFPASTRYYNVVLVQYHTRLVQKFPFVTPPETTQPFQVDFSDLRTPPYCVLK